MLNRRLNVIQLVWLFRLVLAASVLAISILAFSSGQIQTALGNSDKIQHGVAFFFLAFFIDGSFRRSSFLKVKLIPLLSYALLIELVQRSLPYRDFSMLDVGADLLGIILYWLSRKYMRRYLM